MHLATKPIFIATAPIRAEAWSHDGQHMIGFGDDMPGQSNAFSINVESEQYARELAAAINAIADLHEGYAARQRFIEAAE